MEKANKTLKQRIIGIVRKWAILPIWRLFPYSSRNKYAIILRVLNDTLRRIEYGIRY